MSQTKQDDEPKILLVAVQRYLIKNNNIQQAYAVQTQQTTRRRANREYKIQKANPCPNMKHESKMN